MRRFFRMMIVAVAAVCMVAGCQKYDDSELRKELQELRDKLSSLEAWCSSSQSAIDAVSVLQKAVSDMNSVESIEPFIDADGATGYVITFTNKQTIKLYNGQKGKDGDTFFGSVVVNDDCIIFTLADGRTFTVPRQQDNTDYLFFEAVEAGATVSLEIIGEVEAPSLKYSTNKLDWIDFDFSNPVTITLKNVGDKVYWRNTGKAEAFSIDNENYIHFVLGERKVSAGGNVMSLIDISCETLTIPSNSCFAFLFSGNAFLVGAPLLPATELKPNCYSSMFRDCATLEKAPELPATELPESCYYCMFRACSSLTEVSDLPANKVGYGSCFAMFRECSSLEKAPALPAKQLDAYCYQQMFWGCSFKKAPELPATELARSCYSMMFSECNSLKEAPALPALKMVEQCYFSMFQACKSLETAPELPAMDLAGDCYSSMFLLCSSLKNVPALPATKLAEYCYYQMFIGCKSLEDAPALPASELSEGCYYGMFDACSSLETAPALPATKLASYCYYSMFAECSSLESAPELPATELAENCYGFMFNACSSLEAAPALPATKLAPYCYYVMFADCSSLESAPELPATELAESCYGFMFGSSGLKKAPELPATELAPGCYFAMFTGCYSLENAPELPAKKLAASCYESMFDDCPKLNYIKVGFEDWREDIGATAGWVVGVGSEGVFECPESLAVKYGEGCIPTGWSVNGAVPAAAKSLVVPASCSSVEKPAIGAKHARRAMLKPELTGPEMISL